MNRKKWFVAGLVVIGVLGLGYAVAQETITVTTYYPAPYGNYNTMEVSDTLEVNDIAAHSNDTGRITFFDNAKNEVYATFTDDNAWSQIRGPLKVNARTDGATANWAKLWVEEGDALIYSGANTNARLFLRGDPANLVGSSESVLQSNSAGDGFEMKSKLNIALTAGVATLAAGSGTASAGIYLNGASVHFGGGPVHPDLAEAFGVQGPSIEPGDAVVIADSTTGAVSLSAGAYDPLAIGVYSGQDTSTFLLGSLDGGRVPIALVGRVFSKVTTLNGPVKRGDPVTTSGKPGYLMKATEAGSIVGRALEELEEGESKILVFINPGWFEPSVSEKLLVLAGTAVIQAGEEQVKVAVPGLTAGSKVLLTWRGNIAPATHSWVEAVGENSFTVAVNLPVGNDVAFDYQVME